MSTGALRVARVDFTSADLAAARRFYGALGFEAAGEPAPVAAAELAMLGLAGSRAERLTMRLGAQEVSFVRFEPPGRPFPEGSTSTDLWFQHIAIAVSDAAEAHRRALAAGARAITRGGPQTLPPNTGRVTAWKFRDPEGHPLELIVFPPGTGAEAWHARGGAGPFLGIDHTAVAVADASAAASFFEALGLRAGAGSHNSGPGQERLDDVEGDRCRVVPMQPPTKPPHVELLGYEAGARRPMPAGTRADDAWATRVWIEVAALPEGAAAAPLPGGGGAALLRDPDGHMVVAFEAGAPR